MSLATAGIRWDGSRNIFTFLRGMQCISVDEDKMHNGRILTNHVDQLLQKDDFALFVLEHNPVKITTLHAIKDYKK